MYDYYYYSDMPITITYDLNNEQECKLIDDYYCFKSYLKSLIFGWKKFYYSQDYKSSIIKAHLNKTEFKRFKELYLMISKYHHDLEISPEKYDYEYNMLIAKNDIFRGIFYRGKKEILKIYKSYIKNKLQKK